MGRPNVPGGPIVYSMFISWYHFTLAWLLNQNNFFIFLISDLSSNNIGLEDEPNNLYFLIKKFEEITKDYIRYWHDIFYDDFLSICYFGT
jgi:hypothetical protein